MYSNLLAFLASKKKKKKNRHEYAVQMLYTPTNNKFLSLFQSHKIEDFT